MSNINYATCFFILITCLTACLSYKPNPNIPPLYTEKPLAKRQSNFVWTERVTNDLTQSIYPKAIHQFRHAPIQDSTIVNLAEISNDALYKKYKNAIFFKENIFNIPVQSKKDIGKKIETLYDSLMVDSRLKGLQHIDILLIGYHDEVSYDANVAKDLLVKYPWMILNTSNYAKYLSFARTQEVALLFSKIVQSKLTSISSTTLLSINIISEGRGSMLPDQVKLYSAMDDKRKIVKIFYRLS